MDVFKSAYKYISKYKILFILYILIGIIMSIISLVIPYLIGGIIDQLISKKPIANISQYFLFLVLLFFLNLAINFICTLIYTKLQLNTGFDFNKEIIEYVQELPLSYLATQDMTYLNKIINNDTNSIIIFILTFFQDIISNLLKLIVPFIILIKMEQNLAVIVTFFLLLYLITYVLLRKLLYINSFKMKESQSRFFSKLEEQLSYYKFIKNHGLEDVVRLRLKNSFYLLKHYAYRYQCIQFLFTGLDNAISFFSIIILYIFGAGKIVQGSFTIGKFTIFLNYFNIMTSSAKYFFNLGKQFQDIKVSYHRLNNILNQKGKNEGHANVKDIHKIEIQNLSFGYKQNTTLFRNLNFNFERGNIYCIAGSNGSGKSTFIELLLGLHKDEYQGTIKINELEIADINTRKMRRSQISYVEQFPEFFNDTIKYNVLIGNSQNISDSKLETIMRLANLKLGMQDSFHQDYPQINEITNNLSGGEKQKLTIIREILKDSAVMILDEPTSSLDIDSTEKLFYFLCTIKKNKIVILVTHDPNIQKKCDIVYHLE